MEFVLRVVLATLLVGVTFGEGWSYSGANGPQNWKDDYPICGNNAQSPINVDSCSAMINDDLGQFDKDTFSSVPGNMELLNNGHTAQVNILEGGYTISDNKLLPADYMLVQFHLHWGSGSTLGSEHTLGGTRYYGELHAVFYNKKYENIGEAVNMTDGLAVLGFFIDIGDNENTNFKKLVDILDEVPNKDDKFTLTTRFSLSSLMPSDISKYYRYSGSLTTPACYESVTWTVFHHPILISRAQADTLAGTLRVGAADSDFIVDNYRPVQGVNGRKVYKNSSDAVHVIHGLTTIMIALSYIISA